MEIADLNTAFTPTITALSQDFSALAEEAVKMLVGEIEDKIPGFEIRVPMKLIERDSVQKKI
jgi:DNA-binding LacI/PurR family transcriptional regulator